MKRLIAAGFLMMLTAFGSNAKAQYISVGAGSTATGDILRGEGIAAWGWGQYNLNTARANSINADTWMRVDTYFAEARRAENARQARIRARHKAEFLKSFNELQDRILNDPQGIDILAGDTLNSIMRKMNSGRYSQSELGVTRILIPVDIVRRIPFKVGQTGHVVSMRRMTHHGNGWPVAFVDEKFARAKRLYDRAINRAFGETLKSATQQKTLEELRLAVEELNKVLLAFQPTMNERSFKEGLNHLADLKQYPGLFGSQKPQEALVALDTYQGTTVEDLRKFMDKYALGFAKSDRPEEREAYRAIYSALRMQGEAIALFDQKEKRREDNK